MGKKKILFLLLGAFIFLSLPPLAFGQLVINEIYYDVNGREDGIGNKEKEGDHEWVEIYNAGEEEMNLNGWQIKDVSGNACSITKENLFLGKGQFAIITGYNSTWDFWNISDDVLKISLGRKIGNGLSNDGDKIILVSFDDGGSVIEMEYKKDAAGEGHSLERIPAITGDFVEQENPTPGRGIFIVFTPTPTATVLPSPQLTSGLTPTVIATATPTATQPTPTFTPTPAPAKAVYQINEVKNEEGETLSSVKIYVDDQYIHHYAPEALEFGDGYYCDDDKKVECGFGEHVIRLEKNGYEDWEETKEIKAGDAYSVNPVMVFLPSPTPSPTATPVSSLSPTERISPSLSSPTASFLLSPTSLLSPWPFADFALVPKKVTSEKEEILKENSGQVLGKEKKEEKKNSGWYFGVGAFYLGASGWRLARKNDNDIIEKLNFEEK